MGKAVTNPLREWGGGGTRGMNKRVKCNWRATGSAKRKKEACGRTVHTELSSSGGGGRERRSGAGILWKPENMGGEIEDLNLVVLMIRGGGKGGRKKGKRGRRRKHVLGWGGKIKRDVGNLLDRVKGGKRKRGGGGCIGSKAMAGGKGKK